MYSTALANWAIYIYSWDGRVHAFPIRISPKVNMIVRLEFELASYDVAVLHVRDCFTGTAFPPKNSHLKAYNYLQIISIRWEH